MTKIYLAVNANGNPITFTLSDTEFLYLYKGYDSNALQAYIKQVRKCDNLPQKRSTKFSKENMGLNKVFHLIGGAFAKLKTIERLQRD